MLLFAQGIEKYFAERLIFKLDILKVYRGDKIGIVGKNGEGKSTLLKVLCGLIEPDNGCIEIKAKIAYVDQLSEQGQKNADSLQSAIFQTKEDGISGGEIMRKKLAAAFSSSFDILALDEPTSNLDISGIDTLNSALAAVETILLISHDRQFLDMHCNKIIEIEAGKISVLHGGYSEYEQSALELRRRQESQYDEYLREKKRLERAVKEINMRATKMKKAPSRMGNSEARLHKRETTAKQAKVLSAGRGISSRIEKMEEIERPKESKTIKLDFSLTDPPQNKIVLSCKGLNFAYGANELFCDAQLEISNGEHLAIIGENGCGKSTLIKLMTESHDAFYKVPKAKIGYMSQNFSILDFESSILQNVMQTAVQSQTICRNVLANMGFRGDDVYKKIKVLSGGELIKVSLARLIVSDCNVLLLDEPTNYLDINSILQVQNALVNYEGTLIFVSHDLSFINAVADRVIKINSCKFSEVQLS